MSLKLPKTIIRPKEVYASLEHIRSESASLSSDTVRQRITQVLKTAYEHGKGQLAEQFIQHNDFNRMTRDTAALMDRLIAILFQFAGNHLYREKHIRLKSCLTLIAVGGYGRKELFPYSDVDILILHTPENWRSASRIAEFILYVLWDMGLQVGQSVRTVDETVEWAVNDITVCTTLLDARLICGNAGQMEMFRTRYWAEVATDANVLRFVAAKLEERDARHKRCGDSRYVLEPNIKDGKGGLRDLQTLHWLARYVYHIQRSGDLVRAGVLNAQELRAYQRARYFLGTVRSHLHLLAGRAEERLTFDMQRWVAGRMGYRDRGNTLAVERFMKAYFLTAKTVGNLTGVFCAVLEDERKRERARPVFGVFDRPAWLHGFIVESGRIAAPDIAFLTEKPSRIIELFAIAQAHAFDIHPRTLRLIGRHLSLIDTALRADAEANRLFLSILTTFRRLDVTLRRMNEAGVLGKFVPDFGRIVGQMQYDMYHIYTVDEHTIFALGLLAQIASGEKEQEFPLATELMRRISSQRVLCLAVLCHDIAKGRGGDHSMLGERVARKLAQRLGFSMDETEMAAWLVRYHLLFSHTAFKRDIGEEKTVADFVAKVQSPERLRLLLVLTVVDIRAVGPHVWNSWKGTLLRELYYRAEAQMGAAGASLQAGAHLPALEDAFSLWPQDEKDAYLGLGNDYYLRELDAPTHLTVAKLLHEAAEQKNGGGSFLAWLMQVRPEVSATEVLIVTEGRKELFSSTAGMFTTVGANIIGAKIFTLKNNTTVERFYVQDIQGKPFTHPRRLQELEGLLQQSANHVPVEVELPKSPSKHANFRIPVRVMIENNVSSYHTVIEVNGRDRPGFLYRVTRKLTKLELGISTAHISSYGERVVDVFYVKDKFGMKITSEAKLKQIREQLLQALEE